MGQKFPEGAQEGADPHADPSVPDVTDKVASLMREVRQGHADAWDGIYALLYEDLHRIAKSQIRQMKGRGQFSPTSLINETWLRLAQSNLSPDNQLHLAALIARAMRFVLIDQARRFTSQRRGEGAQMLPLDYAMDVPMETSVEQLLMMDQALNALAKLDERAAKVVEMRYFGGMSEPEIATVFGITERTVSRIWRKARAYLSLYLHSDADS